MSKLRLIVGISFLLIPAILNAQNWQWSKRTSMYLSSAITGDEHNNYYVAGINPTNTIEKINGNGDSVWAKSIGTSIKSIKYDGNGNIIVIGQSSTNTFFISKLDTSGVISWTKQDTKNSYGISLVINSLGSIYVIGNYSDTLILDSDTLIPPVIGSTYFFMAKYNTSGNCLWLKQGGKAYSNSISIDTNENSYITGAFYGKCNFGTDTLISNGVEDIFIAKYDSIGNCLWAKKAGGKYNLSYRMDFGYAICNSPSGTVYVTGSCTDTAIFDGTTLNNTSLNNDVFIAKYDTNGNLIWVKRYGNGSDDEGRSIEIDAQENIYVGGSHVYTITFGAVTLPYFGNYDLFITKFDSNGNTIWAQNAGGSFWNEYANGILIDHNNDVVVCGQFNQPAYFGNDTLYSVGGSLNGYIAKLSNSSTGTDEVSFDENITVYPNPTSNVVTLLINSEIKNVVIKVYAITGQQVFSKTESKPQSYISEQIDFSNFTNGIYLLQIKTDKKIITKKIIKHE